MILQMVHSYAHLSEREHHGITVQRLHIGMQAPLMTTAAALPSAAPAPSLLANRGFCIFLAGRFVSRAGDALLSLASVWLVLDLTGNNALAGGIAAALEFLPFVLFGLLGGVLVDRWDRRRTMALADGLRGALLLVIPLLAAAGLLQVRHLYVLIFLLSSLGRLFAPARQAIVPEMVEPAQITRANALIEGSGQAAWVFGPLLGGIIVGAAGAANVFYVDAATFFFSAATLLLIRPLYRQPPAPRTGIWKEAAGGLEHVRRTPVLFAATVMGMVGTLAFAPVPVLLPVMVRQVFHAGPLAFSVLMSAFFAGSLAGTAVVGKLGNRLHRGRTLLGGITALGILTLLLAGAPGIVVASAALVALGGLAAAFNVAEYSLLQQETPAELRGRVAAVAGVAAHLLRPPAVLAAGFLAQQYDVRLALGVMALAALGSGLAGLTNRALRDTR
jgi:MFS family permease